LYVSRSSWLETHNTLLSVISHETGKGYYPTGYDSKGYDSKGLASKGYYDPSPTATKGRYYGTKGTRLYSKGYDFNSKGYDFYNEHPSPNPPPHYEVNPPTHYGPYNSKGKGGYGYYP
jgi:hypothetical protein